MIHRVQRVQRGQRGGTRTVTITQTQAEVEAQADEPIVVKLKQNGDPGDDGADGDGDGDGEPIPDKHYYELSCAKISRIMFTFKINNFLKGSLEREGYKYYIASIDQKVYETFKEHTGNQFSILEPYFFRDKERIGRGANVDHPGKNLLVLVSDPFVSNTKSKMIKEWCFVVCDSNRVMVVPLEKVPEHSVAYHRAVALSKPNKPKRGKPSNIEKEFKEKREQLPDAVIVNFTEREKRMVKNKRKQLDKCPTTNPDTNCARILDKGCAVMDQVKHPKLGQAIVDYNKRLNGNDAASTWEEICHPHAATGGGSQKKNRTKKQDASYFGGMPYIIKEVTGEDKKKTKGYKVCKKDNPEKCFSKTPLPKERAEKQRTAIIISELSRRPATAAAKKR